MSSDSQDVTRKLSAEQVETYLFENPDFFHNRDELLDCLVIPHRRGHAISLVERQLLLLRTSNRTLQQDLEILLHAARDSDSQFEYMRRLVLLLMEAQTLNTAIDMVDDSLVHDFGSLSVSLILNKDVFDRPAVANSPRVPCFPLQDICRYSGVHDLFDNRQVVYSLLHAPELQFLFSDNWGSVKTTAVVPLHYRRPLGVLIIGGGQEDKFPISRPYLALIGEIFSRTLERFTPNSECTL